MTEKKSKWKGKTFGNVQPKTDSNAKEAKKSIADKIEPVEIKDIEETFKSTKEDQAPSDDQKGKSVNVSPETIKESKNLSKDVNLKSLAVSIKDINTKDALTAFLKGDQRAGAKKLADTRLKELEKVEEVPTPVAEPEKEAVVEATSKTEEVEPETYVTPAAVEAIEAAESVEEADITEEVVPKTKPSIKGIKQVEPKELGEKKPRPRKRVPIEEIPSSTIESIEAEASAQIEEIEPIEIVKKDESPKPVLKIRLNKYLAKAGVCSRREADALISKGLVLVNGEIITEMGVKVLETDKVVYNGKELSLEQLRYVLLNKPKDSITTMEDTHDRRTVMDLVEDACEERIYPVGRLDRMTTGLLLLTNDGGLAKKLTHPSHEIKKIYVAQLNRDVSSQDIATLLKGIELEDGFAKFDTAVLDSKSNGNNIVIVSLHSGKNRVVRRMFAHLNYRVDKLDRISFSGITKGNLPRGTWRFLSTKEVGFLKMIK
ncbi:MAG: pseudouridine synthase [Flavobacteriales bacterium]|nr:pseudouridine synthase [Flavobacteriales bacterium]